MATETTSHTNAEAIRGYRQGFQTLRDEVRIPRLQVSGEIPRWLSGTLVRATPAGMEIGGKTIRHWFDGLAMLNAFRFGDGSVSYANRYLNTESFRSAQEGKVEYIGLANDPCRAFFKRVSALWDTTPNDNPNVNVARLGDRYLAMTEMPVPMEFDPDSLDTRGLLEWDDKAGGHAFSAHPHYDPVRDEMVTYSAHVSARNSYRVYAVGSGSTSRREIGRVAVRDIAYIHSFGLTENYVVLAEFPLKVNPLRLLAGRPRPLIHQFKWRPENGTRFFVIDRCSGKLQGTYESEGFMAFHHVNAFESGDEIVCDIVVHENGPEFIRALELGQLRSPASYTLRTALHRFRIPLSGGRVSDQVLADENLEVPRINYDLNTHPYRYAYAMAMRHHGSDWYDQIAKVDVSDGSIASWHEPGCYPGEPIFAANPDASSEDEGVLLSVVLDGESGRSFVAVIDAKTMQEVGRAEVPHHIPFGFHGDYFPTR
jgi:carotenoid cleavage dioxygenase-like enzyme